ncbi:MAG: hypothetical protein ACR2QZ_04060 [Woeseiaceae bacterium]
MTTLTGRNSRTIVGYVATLLDYPRWFIEREVDFSNCHLAGDFKKSDARCSTCHFGTACNWLTANRSAPTSDASLDELLNALRTSVEFLRSAQAEMGSHRADCECDTCQWLHDATGFMRQHRHRT